MTKNFDSKMTKILGIIFTGVIVIMFLFMRTRHISDGDGMVNTLSGSLTGVEYCLIAENEHKQISLLPADNGKTIYSYTNYSDGNVIENITFETDEYRLDSFREICHLTECLVYNTPVEPSAKTEAKRTENVIFRLGEKKIVFDSTNIYPENCNGIYEYVYNALILIKEQ